MSKNLLGHPVCLHIFSSDSADDASLKVKQSVDMTKKNQKSSLPHKLPFSYKFTWDVIFLLLSPPCKLVGAPCMYSIVILSHRKSTSLNSLSVLNCVNYLLIIVFFFCWCELMSNLLRWIARSIEICHNSAKFQVEVQQAFISTSTCKL